MKKSLNFLKIGKKIGSLTLVKKINPKPGHTNPRWICECECGKHKIIREDSIKQQKCKTSCGKCVEIKNIGESIVVKIEKNKITARCKCGNVFIRTKKILKSKNPLCNECNKKRKSKVLASEGDESSSSSESSDLDLEDIPESDSGDDSASLEESATSDDLELSDEDAQDSDDEAAGGSEGRHPVEHGGAGVRGTGGIKPGATTIEPCTCCGRRCC